MLQSAYWLSAAADLGQTKAQNALGFLLWNGVVKTKLERKKI